MMNLTDGQVEDREQPVGEPGEECSSSHPCPVVAIGASAGGLEGFQELFRHMPADTGFAFVLIQHLSPRHETLIPELLAPLTPMPVRTVEDETLVHANHIYVMPPQGALTIDDCVLYLSKPARAGGRRSPIDRFFRSLAEDQEDEAVAIILSGTGSVREHVQRLGRLLRKHGEKQAVLYEVVTRDTAEEITSDRRRQHHAYR